MRPFLPALVLLLLVFGSRTSRASDEIDLGRPTALMSPDTPPILKRHLATGIAGERELAWPLPHEGPLLVLGIPDQDPAARAVADALGLLPACGDLHGGYVVAAWHDGGRPIGVILAADGAALALARRELRLDAAEPSSISLAGPWRWARPRLRRRILALDPARGIDAAADTAIAGRASLVLVPDGWVAGKRDAGQARLRAHGIRVLTENQLSEEDGGLAILAPTPAATVDAAFLRRTQRRLGRSLLLAEDWNGPWCRAGAPVRIPSPPPERSPALLAALEGMVVHQGCGALEILDALAGGLGLADASPRRPWEVHLLPALPTRWSSPSDFLSRTANRLAGEAAATHGAVPWMGPLAADLGAAASTLDAAAIAVPYVPARVVVDGHRDEPAWAHAAALGDLLVMSDGVRLHLGFRTAQPDAIVEVRVRDELGGESRILFAARPGGRGARPRTGHDRDAPILAEAWTDGSYGAEATISEVALAGEAYPTRMVEIEVLRHTDRGAERVGLWTAVVVR